MYVLYVYVYVYIMLFDEYTYCIYTYIPDRAREKPKVIWKEVTNVAMHTVFPPNESGRTL